MTRWFFAALLLCASSVATACPLCLGAFRSSVAQQLVDLPHAVLAQPGTSSSRSSDARKYRLGKARCCGVKRLEIVRPGVLPIDLAGKLLLHMLGQFPDARRIESIRMSRRVGDVVVGGNDIAAQQTELAAVEPREKGIDQLMGRGTVEQFPGQQSRTALRIAVAYIREKKAPEQKIMLLTPIVINKDNFDKAERIGELK